MTTAARAADNLRRKQLSAEREKEFIEDAERAIMFGLGEHDAIRYLGYTNARTVEARFYKLGRTDLAQRFFSRLEKD